MYTQVFTSNNYTVACDVYSLAVCVWEVLTGQVPYRDANGIAPDIAKYKHNKFLWYADVTNTNPPLRPSPMPSVPEAPELNELIEQAWAKEPTSRPTAAELHRRLVDVKKKFSGGDAPLHAIREEAASID